MEQARGQVGDRDYDNLVQEASAFILSPNNFRSANSKIKRQVAKGSKQEKSG
jgi:hypothetical protein